MRCFFCVPLQKQEKKASTATEAATDADTESSTAIVKSEGKEAKKGKGGEAFDKSNIIYADDQVPYGPLGIFPEKYTELQAKVCRCRWSE